MTTRPGALRWLRERFENVVALLGLGASVATVIAFAGQWWWAIDLATHFRVQYFGGLLVAAIVLRMARRRRLAVFFGVMCLVNLATIVPLYLPRPSMASEVSGTPVRFMQVNVQTSNLRFDLVATEVARVDPDVLVLQEIDTRWRDGLKDALDSYPHSIVRVRRDNFGIAVYSRIPMQGAVVDIGDSTLPSIVTRLEVGDGACTLIATHPLPPKGRAYSTRRNDQLAAVGALAAETSGPVVVLGDLNATPWSAHYRALLRVSALRDASRGRGVHATWPANFPVMLIPIDHFLYSDGVEIVDERVGAGVGSDHYPIIVDTRIAP